MMNRDLLCIERIAGEIDFLNQIVKDLSFEDFMHDEMIQHAVSMALINIGECSDRLSDAFKEKHTQIEWVQIIAVRNIATHGYWQLDMSQIWQALIEDIPVLNKFTFDVLNNAF